jgi:undecaprenyl-diphosphatase
VNLAIKPIGRRTRPDRARAGVPGIRQVQMPESTSFPSGHSASAFAFATAISRDRPWVALGAGFLAATVAYSRVHTGVHYPGDTVIGSLIGASTGLAVAGLLDRRAPRGARPTP